MNQGLKNPFPQEENEEVKGLLSKLKLAQQEVAEARAKSKDLKEAIEEKKKELTRLEELHLVNQEVIVKNEKELSSQRGAKTYTDLIRQKESLETGLKQQFERLTKQTDTHLASVTELTPPPLPDAHANKVIQLMLSQLALYEAQLHQRQTDLEQAIARHSRQLKVTSEDIAHIGAENKQASAARLADMKRVLKLVRTEAYTAETIRNHGLKPTDEIAAEATGEVMVRLREKLGSMDENTEFLRSLEEKLKRRGINLELSE